MICLHEVISLFREGLFFHENKPSRRDLIDDISPLAEFQINLLIRNG